MAIDCSDVPSNVSYSCAQPWGQDCTSKAGFDLKDLWSYTQNIQKACPTDPRLFGHFSTTQNASLTPAACLAIAGKGWQYYPIADIWGRVTSWKLPLLQLAVSLPRPPLSSWVEWFVIVHLMGDPIDTIRNLLLKLATCDRTAGYWRTKFPDTFSPSVEDGLDRDWKALTIVVDAYDEWGEGKAATSALEQALDDPNFREAIHLTASAIAADRATMFLPIIAAQSLFIGAIAIATARTAAAAKVSSDTLWINIEAHGIAFSAQYFWILPAVFLGSVIGASQTKDAIPRILRRFQIDLDHLRRPKRVVLPNNCLDGDQKRVFHGGIYSWQPTRWHSSASNLSMTGGPGAPITPSSQSTAPVYHPASQNGVEGIHDLEHGSRCERRYLTLAAYLMVTMGTMTGMVISAFVPPDGWDCRHNGEILILLVWILSAISDIPLSYLLPKHQTWLFCLTFAKDLIAAIATLGGIIVTMFGIFHQCDCYTLWGKTGLALPQMPDVADKLRNRIYNLYPGLAFGCIGIELLFVPLAICFRYCHAIRVFVQRDNGESNAPWLWKLYHKYHNLRQRRVGTLASTEQGAQRGLTNDLTEMERLTRAQSLTPEPDETSTEGQQSNYTSNEAASFSSSGRNSRFPTGSGQPAFAPRRRHTESQSQTNIPDQEESAGLAQNNNKALHRKPLPPSSQMQGR
ncbi:hypothetical protein N7G274_008530 [Stereocaulon virgatum]|uniref:Uncharacterized protein n=1 Tax=Stereocaulon virgatum TaxID=373712 RepID=A0ABR3ZYJ8_9LECA